ncbi:MAG TPA: hypothetical protein VFN11_00720 [Ktedonobacterales bacterium]|nr:hypothetical protein [Ktedonobacterales bacterium]
MSDRELLELAAKAAGIDVIFGSLGMAFHAAKGPDWSKRWNPIGDDGDALRLAVKCRIGIWFEGGGPEEAGQRWVVAEYCGCGHNEVIEDAPDENAATRRAIVRAAAEIGRAMP